MASIDLYTTSNLLRYISEWDPREPAHTKGGYMDGEIKIPNVEGKLRMEIQTFPADDVDPLVGNIHPCLLHVVMIGKGKRDQKMEPVPTYYHWKQVFQIENGKVYVVNRMSELDVEKDGSPRQVPPMAVVTDVKGNSIVLGRKKDELNLILLQPKQQARAKPTEATVTKVLADRLQINNKEKLELYEQYFKKKFAKNLKRVRLRVDFYKENGDHCGSSISPQTIVDTGNKEIGSMDFYDATPHKSCVKGGRKIIMVSEYNLAKDVLPIFQVHDESGVHRCDLDKFINQPQPDDYNLKNQTIIFLTPAQPRLQELHKNLNNFSIKLLAKRKGDGYTSNKMFNFRYIDHKSNSCLFCDFNVDSDEVVQIESGIEGPKPGGKKRKMNPTPVLNCKRTMSSSSDGSSQMNTYPGASPPYDISGTFEIQASSPDSGVDTRFNGYISDGGYTSNSDQFEYTTTLTQEQLENLGATTEAAKFVMAEDDVPLPKAHETADEQFQKEIQLMEQDIGEFVDENEVRKVLGMDSENIESHWGHKEIKEQYHDNIENIDIDQLYRIDVPEIDFGQQTAQISNLGSSFYNGSPHYNAMNSYGNMSIIQTDGASDGMKHVPVVLQHRIQKDSMRKEDLITKMKVEEVEKSEVKDKSHKMKQRTPKQKKPSIDQESTCIEDFPLLTMIFMVFLIIFKLIGESVFEISHAAVIVVAMAFAMCMVYGKNKLSS
eukprot:TRINITY_DN8715_c0_g1_i1.p1 TRINITY_DN8715_c0_g1~~TRINITY_DN8715_c0_g1_i1.p1  ORF type:complete len:716 (-),score=145.66 TRINITY_DN8715_c0_g1_i1:91-2238(-)